MSAKASGYAKELVVCPNGELISAREKLVLMVLADSHQVKEGTFTFPSVDTIAADGRCDRRSCQRYLAALERKGVIRRLRPANQGAGMRTYYFFPEIESIPEGWQAAALFFRERAAEGRQKGGRKGGKRAAGCRPFPIECARAEEPELELEPVPPNPQAADAAGGGARLENADSGVDDALQRVCDACSFTAKRLKRKLRVVLVERVRVTGQEARLVADAMIDAWQRYTKQGLRLFKHVSAAEFFETGLWIDSNSWPWDANFIREERQRAQAKAGSWG